MRKRIRHVCFVSESCVQKVHDGDADGLFENERTSPSGCCFFFGCVWGNRSGFNIFLLVRVCRFVLKFLLLRTVSRIGSSSCIQVKDFILVASLSKKFFFKSLLGSTTWRISIDTATRNCAIYCKLKILCACVFFVSHQIKVCPRAEGEKSLVDCCYLSSRINIHKDLGR